MYSSKCQTARFTYKAAIGPTGYSYEPQQFKLPNYTVKKAAKKSFIEMHLKAKAYIPGPIYNVDSKVRSTVKGYK